MRIIDTRSVIALVACLGMLAAASGCAEDDKQGSANTSSTELAGEPVRFSVLYPEGGTGPAPEVLSGAQAAASAINADAGIAPKAGGDARPIELVPCDADTTSNPNNAIDCAKKVVSDGVVLDVGKYTLAGDEVDVFSAAGIAMLGTNPFSEKDLTGDNAFPLGGAGASLVPGTAAVLQSVGAKKVAYLSLDIPAAHAAANFITPILEDPEDLVATTLLPLDPAADLTAYWTQLADAAPDGVMLGIPSGMTAQAVNGLRAAGYEGIFVATPYTLTAEAIEALGDEADDVLVASNYDAMGESSTNPTIEEFRSDMAEYAPDAVIDELSLNAWLSVRLAAEVAAELDEIDAAGFARALEGREVDLGVAPPFVLGTQDIYLPFPRVFRATVQPQKLDGDEVVNDGEWIDLNDLAG